MTGRKSQSAESSSDENENGKLIAQLLKKIEDLESKINEKSTGMEDQEEFNKYKINQDDPIKIVSLCPYLLNLLTEKNGPGRVYSFSSFGEVKRIVYSDVMKIIETNRNFLDRGFFYLMDSRLITKHGLGEIYEKILTKESIEKILEGKSNDIVSLFKSANPTQKEIVVDLLIEKMVKYPDSIDLNMVDKIYRASGVNIQQKADEARKLQETLNIK
jgi:hypothetical protein